MLSPFIREKVTNQNKIFMFGLMKRLLSLVAIAGLMLATSATVTAKELQPEKVTQTSVFLEKKDLAFDVVVYDATEVKQAVLTVQNQFAFVDFNVVEFGGREAERYPEPGNDGKVDNRFINGLTNLNRQKQIPESEV